MFAEKVYNIVSRIPRGKVLTYIRSDGGIGGFVSGVKKKMALLTAEGVEVRGVKINLEKFSAKINS